MPGAPIDSEFGPDGRSTADREAIKVWAKFSVKNNAIYIIFSDIFV